MNVMANVALLVAVWQTEWTITRHESGYATDPVPA